MTANDLKPGKIPGWWTAEELKPQLGEFAWEELVEYVRTQTRTVKRGNVYDGELPYRLETVDINKRPDYVLSAFDIDVFFAITDN